MKIRLPRCCSTTFHNLLIIFIYLFLIPIPHMAIIIFYATNFLQRYQMILILIFSLLFYVPLAFCLCSHMGYTQHMNFESIRQRFERLRYTGPQIQHNKQVLSTFQSIDISDVNKFMKMVKTKSKSFEAKNAGWIRVRVFIGDIENFKNAEGFINEFHMRTFLRYTKYFIDRPSHEGFKRSILDIT